MEDSLRQLLSDFKHDKNVPVKFGNNVGINIQSSDQSSSTTGRQPVLQKNLETRRQPVVQDEVLLDKLDNTAAAQLHYLKEKSTSNKLPSNSIEKKETFAPIDCFTTPTV